MRPAQGKTAKDGHDQFRAEPLLKGKFNGKKTMKDKHIILAVDDHPKNTEFLKAHLVPQGYEVVRAANGEEALKILSGNKIDLVLLKIMMPGMSSFEVLDFLK
jgi:response regulator RpfG family c-di-GMP phosphodiesterase